MYNLTKSKIYPFLIRKQFLSVINAKYFIRENCPFLKGSAPLPSIFKTDVVSSSRLNTDQQKGQIQNPAGKSMDKVSNGNATFKVYYRENSVMLLTIFWSHLCWFICLLIASLVLPSQQIFSCSKSTILEKCDKIGPKLATKISERCQ